MTIFPTSFSDMSILIPLAVVVPVFLLLKISHIVTRRKDLPPGPPTVPVLGNLHLMPSMDHMHHQ